MLAVLAAGLTMMLAALYPRYRDMSRSGKSSLQLLFYASPILYVITFAARGLPEVARGSRTHRDDPHADAPRLDRPQRAHGSRGDRPRRAGCCCRSGITVALFVLGLWVFKRETPRIAENL